MTIPSRSSPLSDSSSTSQHATNTPDDEPEIPEVQYPQARQAGFQEYSTTRRGTQFHTKQPIFEREVFPQYLHEYAPAQGRLIPEQKQLHGEHCHPLPQVHVHQRFPFLKAHQMLRRMQHERQFSVEEDDECEYDDIESDSEEEEEADLHYWGLLVSDSEPFQARQSLPLGPPVDLTYKNDANYHCILHPRFRRLSHPIETSVQLQTVVLGDWDDEGLLNEDVDAVTNGNEDVLLVDDKKGAIKVVIKRFLAVMGRWNSKIVESEESLAAKGRRWGAQWRWKRTKGDKTSGAVDGTPSSNNTTSPSQSKSRVTKHGLKGFLQTCLQRLNIRQQ
jgi:hypothetical protein